jgi:hypothetical protein
MMSRTSLYKNVTNPVRKRFGKKFIIIFLIIFVIATAGTYAWFVSTSDEESSLTAGSVAVTMDNTLTASGNVLPGEAISGNVSITNSSDVDIYLRMKVEVTTVDFYENDDTFDDVFSMTLSSDWVKIGDWYYRKGLVTSGTGFSDILSSFTIKGTVGNEYQGKIFDVNAVAEAIQGTSAALDGIWILNGDIEASDKITLEY